MANVVEALEERPRATRKRRLLVADLFCGAGGSSTGARRALERLGYRMDLLCVNHWPTAIETHKKNHPEARHYCQDINTVRPHLVVPEGRLDLLMASPTCIFHSRARGGKPTSDQQRMDPWHVVTWLTELRVRCLIIENVPEFQFWGPVDPRTGRPLKSRRGEYFNRWVETIRALGFAVDWRILNAADYGDATTRQRFFLLARSDGKPIRWPAPTHAKMPTPTLYAPPLEKWRAAREIIDWQLKGKSIFDRKKPLSPKTLARIYAGAVKFKWPEPFLVILRQHMGAQSVDGPVPTITAGGNHIYLAEPFLFGNRENNVPKSTDDPTPTATTATGGGIAMVEPFVSPYYGPSKTGKPRASRGIDEPLATQGTENRFGLVEPFIATVAHGDSPGEADPSTRRAHSVDDPLGAITASGGQFGVVEPMVVRTAMHKSNSLCVRGPDDPLPTITTDGGLAVVEPFMLSRQGGGAPRSIEEPTPCQVAKHSHVLVEPSFVIGQQSCAAPRSVEEPIPTVATAGKISLLAPYYGTGSCKPVSDPVPTVTTKDRFGLVTPVTHSDSSDRTRDVEEPLPTVTGAQRGELAFITAAFGERPGQTPRVHSVEDPAPTICAEGRVNLAVAEVVVGEGRDFDILFRMLEPHELAAAMGFTADDVEYEFVGTKTDVTRQIGNAVPVHVATALVAAQMEAGT